MASGTSSSLSSPLAVYSTSSATPHIVSSLEASAVSANPSSQGAPSPSQHSAVITSASGIWPEPPPVSLVGMELATPQSRHVSVLSGVDSTLSQPLLGRGEMRLEVEGFDCDLLSRAILDVMNSVPINDTTYRLRRSLQVVAGGVAGATKVFFVPVSLTLPAGEAFATGGVISWWCFEFFGAHSIIEDLIGPRGEHELALLQYTKGNRCRKTAIVATSFTIALITQIVYAFAVYKYNNEYARIPAVIVTMLSGSLFPTRSLQLTFEKIAARRQMHTEFERKLIAIRSNVAKLIHEDRQVFVEMSPEERTSAVTAFAQISMENTEQLQLVSCIRELLALQKRAKPKVITSGDRCVDGLSKVTGSLLAATMQVAFATYTWNNTKAYIVDNDGAAFVGAAIVVGSSVYLSSKSILETTNYLARSLFNCLRGARELSIAEQLYPQLSFCLKTVGLVSDVFAQGSAWVIWGDYFGGPVCTATFVLLYVGTLYVIDKVVEEYIRRKGDPHDKQVLALYDKLGDLERVVKSNSLLHFSSHLMHIPEDLRKQFTDQFQVTYATLQAYVDKDKA